MPHKIEPFKPEDFDAVLAFWKSCQPGVGLNESDERAHIIRFLERNPNMSFIARDPTGNIIAAVLCGHDGRRGYLHHLAVAQSYRRQGLGKELVHRCLSQLTAAGIPKCNIFLFKQNTEAQKFWQSQGYRTVDWITLQRRI
jgi:putative acetyltransferase